jgi:hypothetical protein
MRPPSHGAYNFQNQFPEITTSGLGRLVMPTTVVLERELSASLEQRVTLEPKKRGLALTLQLEHSQNESP